MNNESGDKFVDMVSARAKVTLPIGEFEPRCALTRPETVVERPKFSAIDYHNHLDSVPALEALRVMDACGVDRVVSITMQVSEAGLAQMDRLREAAADRFATIGWMDWDGVERADFVQVSCGRLERMVEHGAVGLKIWKDCGLTVRDASGELLRIDDERLAPIFEKAGELNLPVMFHTADPTAFFDPIDRFNERYEELAAHPEWGWSGSPVGKRALLEARNRVIGRHPQVQFVGAHLAESGEDLGFLAETLDRLPNLMVDISARTPELARQPYRGRELMVKYADRIVFGTDLLPEVEMYRGYFRILETKDEFFDYPTHASRQGRWQVYGLYLPDDVLRKVYRENALRLLDGR